MKKLILSVLMAVSICSLANALDIPEPVAPTNAPSVSEAASTFAQAAWNAARTNLVIAPYAIFTPGLEKKTGYGFGLFYAVTDHVITGLRFEYVNDSVWMPDGTCTFKVDFHPIPWFPKFTLSPFVYGGIAYPLSGLKIAGHSIPGKDNQADDIIGISGIGSAVTFYDSVAWHVGLVGDVEKWSSVPQQEYRLGAFVQYRK